MKRSLPLIICAVVAMSAGVMRGATQSVETLTLERALALAEELQPQLAEASARLEAAAGRAQQAGVYPNPAAIARVEQAPLSGRGAGDAEYLAGLAQPVPLGRRLSKAREAEQLDRARLGLELDQVRRELHRRVHSAFATALYQEQAFLAQSTLVGGIEQIAKIAQDRAVAGDAVQADVARAEMELARGKIEVARAGALREQAVVHLAAVIGDPRLKVQRVEGKLDTTLEIPALESLAARLSEHPALAAAAADVRTHEARIALAEAQRVPDLNVEVLYRRVESSRENRFDLGLSVPLPFFDRQQGRLREARADLQAANARQRSVGNNLAVRLQEAYAQLNTALAGSRALKIEILPRADTVLKAAEARYEAGDASLAEVLPVRREWAALQLSYLESLRDVLEAWTLVKSLDMTK